MNSTLHDTVLSSVGNSTIQNAFYIKMGSFLCKLVSRCFCYCFEKLKVLRKKLMSNIHFSIFLGAVV